MRLIRRKPEPGVGVSTFVGRERELGELRAALDTAWAGNGAFILIAGEPGVGKTRLANEFGREAARRGARVLRGGTFEGGGAPPYWPWVQILRAALAEAGGARPAADRRQSVIELRELVPAADEREDADLDLARFRLFDGVAGVIRTQCAIQPLVVVLDDLQWADDSSLQLLQFLGRELVGMRTVLVGVYRDVEADQRPETRQRIAALACDARTIALGGLALDEVSTLIEQTTQRPVSDAVVAAVHRATGGSPLFVDELVRSLVAEGRLDAALSATPLPVPERVRALVRRRIAQLSDRCRRVLAVAAVIGRDFDLAAVAETHAAGGDRPLDAIDEACDAQIVSAAGGRFAFVHDLFREALYDDLASEERRRLHGAVGTALERVYAADLELHLPELAHHFLHAEPGSEKAMRYSLRAADRAARQLAFEGAVAHCEAALATAAAAEAPDPARRCEILLALGANLWKMSAFERSRQIHAEAAELAETLGLPEMQARAALGFGGHEVTWDRSNNEPALVDLLERALAAIEPADGVARASLMARLGTALAFSSPDRARAEDLGRGAVAMARRLGDAPTLHFCLQCCDCAVWGPDTLEERIAIGTELARLAREIGATPDLSLVPHLEEAGDLAGARHLVELHEQGTLGARRYLTTTWILTVWRAMSALVQGRLEDAERSSFEAFQMRQAARSTNAEQYFGAQLLVLRREQGRLAEMVGGIEAFTSAEPAAPVWRLALGWVYAELDRTREAAHVVDELAGRDFTDVPRDMYWLMCFWLLAEIVAKLDDRRRAEVLYPLLLPYRTRCAVVPMAFNGASLERSLGLLAATARRWDEAADHFEAAIATNQRIGARPWAAHAEHEYARMLLARGRAADRTRARALVGSAVATARTLDLTALLARAEALRGDLAPSNENEALFRREGEYWTLAFGGDTGRVRDARGLHLISFLLCAPGRDIPAAALAVWPEHPPPPGADGRVLARDLGLDVPSGSDRTEPDARARGEYRERLAALRDEADEADRFNDPLRAGRARAEMTAIADALGRSVAHARVRKDGDRARLAVTKAIRYAVRKIERAHPHLGRLLAATVKTGNYCRYEPDPRNPVHWVF